MQTFFTEGEVQESSNWDTGPPDYQQFKWSSVEDISKPEYIPTTADYWTNSFWYL